MFVCERERGRERADICVCTCSYAKSTFLCVSIVPSMCVDSAKLVAFVFVLIFVDVLRIVLEICIWDDCVGKNQFTCESC